MENEEEIAERHSDLSSKSSGHIAHLHGIRYLDDMQRERVRIEIEGRISATPQALDRSEPV